MLGSHDQATASLIGKVFAIVFGVSREKMHNFSLLVLTPSLLGLQLNMHLIYYVPIALVH